MTTTINPNRLASRATGRAVRLIGNRLSRRGFVGRSAMVGSALVVGGSSFALRPGRTGADGGVGRTGAPSGSKRSCGCSELCCSGYTEFCCHIYGQNLCPSGTLLAGWWKVDNSTYCDGAARYYMDCNKASPDCGCGSRGVCRDSTPCQCRTCDSRRDGCTVFRYGNCNNQVACVGPIVCRVVTCTEPWLIDPGCTTIPRTDPATATHHRACLVAPIEITPEAEAWARAVYADYLGRAPSPEELEALARPASGGVDRVQLSVGFSRSDTYLSAVLDELYRSILGRTLDDSGRNYWIQQLRFGATVTSVAAFVYGSDEYYDGYGTDVGFVTSLYEKILERSPDQAGLDYWVGIASRPDRRPSVGGFFFDAIESRRRRVDGLYRRFLGRRPDAEGREYWARILASGDDLALATHLSGSVEYWNRAQLRFG